MDPKEVKKTQDTLGKVIKKPPLTEKLLNKPPFRFLHDVFTEVIRTTEFMKGLFSAEEMDSKNVTSKEAKIAFLKKVIECVTIVSGETLAVRPNKVIAGHEPEHTNALLQVIAQCIKNKMSSDTAVEAVLSGKGKAQSSANKTAESTHTDTTDNKEGSSGRKSKHEKRSEHKRHESSKDSAKQKSESKESNKESETTDQDKKRHKSSKHRDEEASLVEPDREKKRHKSSKHRDQAKDTDKGLALPDHDQDKKRHKSGRESSRHKREVKEADEKSTSAESEKERKHREKKKKHVKDEEDQFQGMSISNEPEQSSPTVNVRGPRPASAKGQRRKPKHDRAAVKEDISDGDDVVEKSARPPSARPGAPKIKHRADMQDDQIDSGAQHIAPVIIDKDLDESHSDDEDAQFVVKEETPLHDIPAALPVSDDDQDVVDEEHGGLVKKILETKKELEQSAAGSHDIKHTDIERSTITAQQKKEREMVAREIEELRSSVQKLCQSVAPLAKIIDYIQEDMDAMQNELAFWKNENKQHAMRLKEEESITKRSIEPLNHELQELQGGIASYRNQMAATKANIIRNDEKIRKMVMAVATRS